MRLKLLVALVALASLSVVSGFLGQNVVDRWRGNVPPSRRRYAAAFLLSATSYQETSLLSATSKISGLSTIITAHELDARQTQEVVNVASDCIQPSKAWVPEVYCASYANFTTAREVCRTLWTSTTACNVNTVASTFSASGPAMTVECVRGVCGRCVATPVAAVGECTDCITSGSSVFVSQATAFPSGTAPPIFTGPLSPLPSQTSALAAASAAALKKRTMPDPVDYRSYDEFMVDQCEVAAIDDLLVPLREDDRNVYPSAKIKSFRNEPFSIALQGLVGCTSIILVSWRGVWMSHFWEEPSFTGLYDDAFEKDVVIGAWSGDNSGEFPGFGNYMSDNFFQADASGNTDNKIKVYIVTPATRGTEWPVPEGAPDTAKYWKYMPNVWQLYQILREGGVGEPQVVTYNLLEAPEGMEAGAAALWRQQQAPLKANGRVVLLYDPQQYWQKQDTTDASGKVVGECNVPYASYQLYVDQYQLVYQDSWAAFEEQLQGADIYNNGQQRRSNEQKVIDWSQPVCIRVNATTTSTSTSFNSTTSTMAHNSTTSTTSYANTTTATTATTTATAPPSVTCRIHLYEEILDDVKNRSQTGLIDAQYQLFDWQNNLQQNGSWGPQHNMTDNLTVTSLTNDSQVVFVASFAETNGPLVSAADFDSTRVLEYGVNSSRHYESWADLLEHRYRYG